MEEFKQDHIERKTEYVTAEEMRAFFSTSLTNFTSLFRDQVGRVSLIGGSTVGGRNVAIIAAAINSVGELITANLNTSAKQILGDFTFGESGAIKMITDADNGLWISPTGILGKKAGANTFAIDTSGNATFAGTLSAAAGTLGALEITSAGHIRGGQTAYNTGIGFFLGYSTDKYKFSIGNPASDYLTWDGASLIFQGTTPNSQVFTANGTWTKPVGAKLVVVVCIGGGGGGGGGGSNTSAGTGGGGGSFITRVFRADDLTATVAITVGVGGTAGAAGTNNGGTGGNSTFGSYLVSYGGGGGFRSGGVEISGGGGGGAGGVGALGGTANSLGGVPANTAGSNGVSGQGAGGVIDANGKNAEYGGGAGGGAFTAPAGIGGSSLFAAPGGGGGGGPQTGSSGWAGGAGGTIQSYTAGGGGAGGTYTAEAAGGNGAAGASGDIGKGGGGGGGGGTGNIGGNGGAGGVPSGGAGGGGTGASGHSGGAGAVGGRGEVRIYTI